MFGVEVPTENVEQALEAEYRLFRRALEDRKIDDLGDLLSLPVGVCCSDCLFVCVCVCVCGVAFSGVIVYLTRFSDWIPLKKNALHVPSRAPWFRFTSPTRRGYDSFQPCV